MSKCRLQLLATLNGHAGAVWHAAYSKDGLLATCGVDRTVRVWQATGDGGTGGVGGEWRCVAVSRALRRTVRRVAWGSDGRSIAVACFDGVATVLELSWPVGLDEAALEPMVTLEGHESEVKGVAYSGSGGLLATCSRDRSVWIWEVGPDFEYECIGVMAGHTADVKSVTWHPEMELLVSCGYDSVAKVWAEDEDDWFCVETLGAHSDTVWHAAFDVHGRRLATCGADGALVLWSREADAMALEGGGPRFAVAGRADDLHDGAVYGCSFSADGKRVVTCGGDDAICVVSRGERPAGDEGGKSKDVVRVVCRHEDAHHGDVNCAQFRPRSNDEFVSCGDDGKVRVWAIREDSASEEGNKMSISS